MIFSYSEPIMGSIVQTIYTGLLPWEMIVGGSLILVSNILIALKPEKKDN